MMNNGMVAWPDKIRSALAMRRIVAVLVIDDPADAEPVARALVAGGVDIMELTLRTPIAFEALARIRDAVPRMIAGVGTVLTPEQCRKAHAVGADFAVAPGFRRAVVEAAIEVGLPFGPGIATPSEIEAAYELGCTILKLFPAEPLGGLPYLTSMNAPYAHLNLSYIPLGGVNEENLERWLLREEIIAVGGSWIAPRSLILERNWDEIERRARASRAVVDAVTEASS
ncbi:MAG: bifunctional 4-hydroxy-2-oxoglutarate aldolase/2-dehydro-3-deoxy-phosphogluconate aldolase [Spirochaetales bacterium]|nr:bifunctional 4-hydroxy-2-oxoglutarate aldolase/2-dehydro-3-deoxy-phosphogluconate aldolase [Spirochaetales bacterium]